jgi:hypothetical protein
LKLSILINRKEGGEKILPSFFFKLICSCPENGVTGRKLMNRITIIPIDEKV